MLEFCPTPVRTDATNKICESLGEIPKLIMRTACIDVTHETTCLIDPVIHEDPLAISGPDPRETIQLSPRLAGTFLIGRPKSGSDFCMLSKNTQHFWATMSVSTRRFRSSTSTHTFFGAIAS